MQWGLPDRTCKHLLGFVALLQQAQMLERRCPHALVAVVASNRELLRDVVRQFKLDAVINVHDLAASNETRTLYVPRRVVAGAPRVLAFAPVSRTFPILSC